MKLRVRVNKRTSQVELEGPDPTLTQLSIRVKEDLLPSAGLGTDTAFTLSLNGKEPLVDTGQTLSSCGVVSGDMISVILPSSDSSSSSESSSSQQTRNVSAVRQTTSQSLVGPGAQEPGTSSSYEGSKSMSAPETDEVNMERSEDEEEAVGLFIPEPMLCCEAEEGKVPHSLEMLYQAAQCNSAQDCLVLAAHVLLLETGFLPQGCDVRAGEMPGGWRAVGGLYRLQYSHPFCENSLAQVVAVPMGQTLVFNATLKTSSTVGSSRKLVLKPDAYMTKDWAEGNAGLAYRDLQKLSRIFKDQLAYPLIATAREELGLPALFGLAVLPPELLLRVMRLLDVSSLLNLSEVCRRLNSTSHDASLWKYLLHRDFGGGALNNSHIFIPCGRGELTSVNTQANTEHRDTDWKEVYKKRFMNKKALNRYRPRGYPFPRIPPIYPLAPMPISPPPIPLYPPGIIGGEYDQRPDIPQNIPPRPRYDPISPFPGHEPLGRHPFGRRLPRPGRAPDPRRGFI